MTKFQPTASFLNLTSFPSAWIALVLASLTMLNAGCVTFVQEQVSEFPADAKRSKNPLYLVQMEHGFGKKTQFKGEIIGSATVQDALEASGAVKKFRSMDVSVYRKIENSIEPLKMAVRYNTSKKSVKPETDYALQHGDRIVVTPASGNSILEVLGNFQQ